MSAAKVISIALIGLMSLCLGASAQYRVQDALPGLGFGGPSLAEPASPQLVITKVGQQRVSSGVDRVVIERLYDNNGLDIHMRIWPLCDGRDVHIEVTAEASSFIRLYGPAHETTDGNYCVYGVRLGEKVDQARSFTVRALALPQSEIPPKLSVGWWHARAKAVSDPLSVKVLRRVVPPEDCIWIQTVDEQTVSSRSDETTVVDPVCTVVGTLQWNEPSSPTRPPYVYLIKQIPGAINDRFEILGPAKVEGIRWEISNASLVDMDPKIRSLTLSAIITDVRLDQGEAALDRWAEAALAKSRSVNVFVRDWQTSPMHGRPDISIAALVAMGRKYPVRPNRSIVLDPEVAKVDLEGNVVGLPEGACVRIILGRPNSEYDQWLVDPVAAFLKDDGNVGCRWTLLDLDLSTILFEPGSDLVLLAVVTDPSLPATIMNRAQWRQSVIQVSEKVHLEGLRSTRQVQPEVRICRVGGMPVEKEQYPTVGNGSSVEVEILDATDRLQVWLACREEGHKSWQLEGPVPRITENRWYLPALSLEQTDSLASHSSVSICAFVNLGGPKPREQTWQRDAIVMSPVVRVKRAMLSGSGHEPGKHLTKDEPTKRRMTQLGMWLVWALVLGMLAALEYRLNLVSVTADSIARSVDGAIVYLRDSMRPVEKVHVPSTLIAAILLALGSLAIQSYYPLYTEVVMATFNMSRTVAQGLARMLIIVVVLAGILFDIGRRKWEQDGEAVEENPGWGYYVTTGFVVVILSCLIIFQATLYREYYGMVATGHLVPRAMSMAAFLVAALEALNFFWVIRLGLGGLAWLCVQLLLLPFWLLSSACKLAASLCSQLPHFDDEEQAST